MAYNAERMCCAALHVLSAYKSVNWLHGIYALLCAVNFRTMIGKTVKYKDKIYQVAQWEHYRLEWFEVELKDHSGYHKFWLKESDVVVI